MPLRRLAWRENTVRVLIEEGIIGRARDQYVGGSSDRVASEVAAEQVSGD